MAAMMTRMTALRVSVAVLASMLAALVALAGASSPRPAAATCSIGSPIDYEGAFTRSVSNSQLLFVGTVASERSLPRPPQVTPMWESVVMPEAMLKGDAPGGPIMMPHLGRLGGDCSGGPRLLAGERVLLPVYFGRLSYDGSQGWQLNGIFSKVLIEGDQAFLESVLGRHPLGDIEGVIRTFGATAGATDAQIDAAILAALAPEPQRVPGATPQEAAPPDTGGPEWTWAVVAALGVTALAGLALIARRLRGQ